MLKLLPVVVAGCLGLAATVYVFQPGYLSPDSITQLGHARSGYFTDWHPPLMSWVWRIVEKVHPGPLGMLLLHNLFFWSGLCLLAGGAFRSKWRAAAAVLLIGFFPPVFALLGTIWKDVGLGVSLLLVVGLLALAERRRASRIEAALALSVVCGLLFYAVNVRYNAVFAALPMCVWTMWIVGRDIARLDRYRTMAAAVSGLVLLLVLFAAGRIAHRLIVDRRLFPSQQILVHDLTGISVRTGRNELPGFVQNEMPLSLEEVQRIYTPHTVVPLYWGDNSTRRLPRYTSIQNENDFSRLAGHWQGVVRRHPREYFAHRWQVARELLALDRPRACLPFITGTNPNPFGVSFQQNRLNAAVTGGLRSVQDTVLFRPGYYLIAGFLLLIALPFITRDAFSRVGAAVLLTSGLLYSLPYYFITTTCDFRMVWWSVVAVLVAPLTMLDRLSSRRGSVAAASDSAPPAATLLS